MNSRAAAKKQAPVKSAPAKMKTAVRPKAVAKAPSRPAARPASKPAAKAVAKPAAKARPAVAAPKAAPPAASKPATAQRAPALANRLPVVASRTAPLAVAHRPAPLPPPRPPVMAAVLVPKRAPLPAPGMAAPRPPPPPKPQPTLARSYFYSDLRVGDDLPPLAKPPVDRVQIARYAVEAHDYNRLHLDEPYAAALGYRTAFAPGALAMGFVAQLLAQWLRRGFVRKLQARFVKIVRPGDSLSCRGRISELRKEKGACLAELELWAENQKGELVLRGHATCALLESASSVHGETGLPAGLRGAPRPLAAPLKKPASAPKKK